MTHNYHGVQVLYEFEGDLYFDLVEKSDESTAFLQLVAGGLSSVALWMGTDWKSSSAGDVAGVIKWGTHLGLHGSF